MTNLPPGHSVTELVPVIKRCKCVGTCYRMPRVETYSVFVMRYGKNVIEDLVSVWLKQVSCIITV